MKITLLNYTYQLKRLTAGEYYITRCFNKRGFAKWKQGKLQHRSGIINLILNHVQTIITIFLRLIRSNTK